MTDPLNDITYPGDLKRKLEDGEWQKITIRLGQCSNLLAMARVMTDFFGVDATSTTTENTFQSPHARNRLRKDIVELNCENQNHGLDWTSEGANQFFQVVARMYRKIEIKHFVDFPLAQLEKHFLVPLLLLQHDQSSVSPQQLVQESSPSEDCCCWEHLVFGLYTTFNADHLEHKGADSWYGGSENHYHSECSSPGISAVIPRARSVALFLHQYTDWRGLKGLLQKTSLCQVPFEEYHALFWQTWDYQLQMQLRHQEMEDDEEPARDDCMIDCVKALGQIQAERVFIRSSSLMTVDCFSLSLLNSTVESVVFRPLGDNKIYNGRHSESLDNALTR